MYTITVCPESFATEILYGAAMAAKEYSVTKFLVEGGFVEDQAAYAKYMLKPTAEDLQAWDMAKSDPLARIIYLVMTIRDVSCAIPLLEDSRFRLRSQKVPRGKNQPPARRLQVGNTEDNRRGYPKVFRRHLSRT
jgi:hypothetical protein